MQTLSHIYLVVVPVSSLFSKEFHKLLLFQFLLILWFVSMQWMMLATPLIVKIFSFHISSEDNE